LLHRLQAQLTILIDNFVKKNGFELFLLPPTPRSNRRTQDKAFRMRQAIVDLKPEEISDIIQMALSDHVSFKQINDIYGLNEHKVKRLMRKNLKAGSYRAWRKRVHDFGTRREFYK
jgi:uncharacterized protein (TIGR03643 family)